MEISKEANLPTKFGDFIIQSFRENDDKCLEHLVLRSKDLGEIPLVRVHSECMTGDVFGSRKCDCGDELEMAMKKIAKENGMIIYLRQEGRGIGLFNKINAYNLQDNGSDTIEANHKLGFEADLRDYHIVGKIFDYYGIKSVRLLTNNPKKISEISKFAQVQRESIIVAPNQHNKKYLQIKQEKLGHLLES